jgi:hypothetical protein
MTIDTYEYFSGGVPPLSSMDMHFAEVCEVARGSGKNEGLDFTAELCMIGLSAYFEVFCKISSRQSSTFALRHSANSARDAPI